LNINWIDFSVTQFITETFRRLFNNINSCQNLLFLEKENMVCLTDCTNVFPKYLNECNWKRNKIIFPLRSTNKDGHIFHRFKENLLPRIFHPSLSHGKLNWSRFKYWFFLSHGKNLFKVSHFQFFATITSSWFVFLIFLN
jgi:hypothetical protein